MFRNQVDTTVQFSKMIIQFMHDFVFKDFFFFTVFKFKTMGGQVYHGPFSAFLMNSNFFPDRFFLSAHTVSWMCVYSPKGAAAFVFDTFCPGGSKDLLTFSDNSGQDRICFRTVRSHIRPVLSINAGASFPALNY